MIKISAVTGLLILVIACTTPRQPELFYSIPAVSYLRETPQYDSQVVAELYTADQVKLLNKSDGWWQVQALRDDKIGWTQRDLLSENPIIPQDYYINADGVPLRPAPNEDILSRNLLSLGDLVQKLDQKGDWWRVLVEKDKTIGWIPAKVVSKNPPGAAGSVEAEPGISEKKAVSPTQTSPAPNHFFVAAETLPLHIIPLSSSQVVKILVLNNKVEKIAQNDPEWMKIRYLDTGAEGWAQARYLKDSPVTKRSQIVSSGRKTRKKGPSRKPTGKEPAESQALEPEGM